MPDDLSNSVAVPPPEVAAVFAGFPAAQRAQLIHVRGMIFAHAKADGCVGTLEETLKWGQPSYLTHQPKSGTTLRLGCLRSGAAAVFVHCQTTLIPDFQSQFPGVLRYEGRRAVILPAQDDAPLRLLIGRALRYHVKDKKA